MDSHLLVFINTSLMRKRLLVFLGVFLLTLLTFFYFSNKSDDLILDEEGKDFALDDFSKVDQIEFIQEGELLKLERVANAWKVEGEALVTADKQRLLSAVFEGLKVRYAAPLEDRDSLMNAILKKGCEVVLKKDGRIMKHFYTAPTPIDSISIYGVLDSMHAIYALYVLGEQIDFESFFSAKEGDWRSLNLWDFPSEKWTGIEFKSNKDSSLNYRLNMEQSSLVLKQSGRSVKIDYGKTVDWIIEIQTRKAKGFLGYELPEDAGVKWCAFTFTKGLISQTYEVSERKMNPGTKNLLGEPVTIDREYFYLRRGEEVFLVDYFSFEPILRGILSFQ